MLSAMMAGQFMVAACTSHGNASFSALMNLMPAAAKDAVQQHRQQHQTSDQNRHNGLRENYQAAAETKIASDLGKLKSLPLPVKFIP